MWRAVTVSDMWTASTENTRDVDGGALRARYEQVLARVRHQEAFRNRDPEIRNETRALVD